MQDFALAADALEGYGDAKTEAARMMTSKSIMPLACTIQMRVEEA